ncbi:hypothetical protein A4A49_53601 [Nicotiana attenuata]|uniref:DUF761 domain-containing protein n=1 Tax=Nicotiana attenuata TaxID=49451 RepID=A0A314KQQ6_NICAT|nr:hypothetical protein A4A49_53601 [Nicotiana attenuata]
MQKWKLTSKILSFRRKHPIRLFNKCNSSSLYDVIRDIDEFEQRDGPSIRCTQRIRSTGARDNVSNEDNDYENDIDRRAEVFIANFRRQLRLERQISLELRYCT